MKVSLRKLRHGRRQWTKSPMDDSSLFDEVLQLTMHRHTGDATEEELARLERLLGNNRQAVIYYLKIVDDGLTVRELAEVRANQPLESTLGDPPRLPTTPGARQLSNDAVPAPARSFGLAASSVSRRRPSPWSSPAHCSPPGDSAPTRQPAETEPHRANRQFFRRRMVERMRSGTSPGRTSRPATCSSSATASSICSSTAASSCWSKDRPKFASPRSIASSSSRANSPPASDPMPSASASKRPTPTSSIAARPSESRSTVRRQTDVVVYEGIVDLDVVGHGAAAAAPARHRRGA